MEGLQEGVGVHLDFQELGLSLPGNNFSWGAVEVWPVLPANEVEFWQYVANAAEGAGVTIPPFMKPVTDLAGIRAKILRWERERQVRHWQQVLGSTLQIPVEQALAPPELTDLRLVFGDSGAELQYLRPGTEAFEPIRAAQLSRLHQAHERGEAQFAQEGEMIWHFLGAQPYTPPPPQVDYNYAHLRGALWRMLRSPQLESRLVNPEGQPLVRPAEPLRWAVIPAGGEEDDYRVCLAQADGAPCPRFSCVLPGRPTLYLTAGTVFKGPHPMEGLLDAAAETRIPAPALESAAGVRLLRSLGVDLPARIRDRVRLLPLEVSITGELRRQPFGRHEECCASPPRRPMASGKPTMGTSGPIPPRGAP